MSSICRIIGPSGKAFSISHFPSILTRHCDSPSPTAQPVPPRAPASNLASPVPWLAWPWIWKGKPRIATPARDKQVDCAECVHKECTPVVDQLSPRNFLARCYLHPSSLPSVRSFVHSFVILLLRTASSIFRLHFCLPTVHSSSKPPSKWPPKRPPSLPLPHQLPRCRPVLQLTMSPTGSTAPKTP